MRIRSGTAILALLATTACATAPGPQDVTGLTSKEITQFVRCEMSNAVRNKLLVLMTEVRSDNSRYVMSYKGRPIEEEVELLKSDALEFTRLDWSKFDKVAASLLPKFAMIVVGYDFTLQAVNDNTLGATLDLVGGFKKKTDKFDNEASLEVIRDNKDHFRIFDNFDSLIRQMYPSDCRGTANLPNPVYPLAGLLSFDNLVDHFFYANEYQNLTSIGKDENFADVSKFEEAEETRTITFTTKMILNADFMRTMTPAHHVFALSPLTIKSNNTRTDTHTVIVNIRQPSSISDAPYFDPYGRLQPRPKLARARAIAATSIALDRAAIRNAQDSLVQIGNAFLRSNVTP